MSGTRTLHEAADAATRRLVGLLRWAREEQSAEAYRQFYPVVRDAIDRDRTTRDMGCVRPEGPADTPPPRNPPVPSPAARDDAPPAADYLTVGRFARRLGVGRSTVYALVSSGRLPHVRVGLRRGTIRIPAAAAAEYMRRASRDDAVTWAEHLS